MKAAQRRGVFDHRGSVKAAQRRGVFDHRGSVKAAQRRGVFDHRGSVKAAQRRGVFDHRGSRIGSNYEAFPQGSSVNGQITASLWVKTKSLDRWWSSYLRCVA
uniref:Uncharacterized protein n=1 Tax=Knipowitschia caucasica TaxID=637954 RepID=A0AAV2K875_KNICA